LLQPQGLAVERDGSILVADAADHRVRRITPGGIIHTVAGDGIAGFRGDGWPATSSRLRTPYGVAVGPNREIYIADLGNGRVRVIAADGTISTFAGGGEVVPADLPVKAVDAKLAQPRNVVVDAAGIVYISDFGANRVYRVTSDGMLSTVAGAVEKLSGPAGLAIDSAGSLFIADSGNHCIRKIVNGAAEIVADKAGNPLDFGAVTSIAVDAAGRLHAAGGARVLIVTSAGTVGAIETAADEVFIDASGRLLTVAYRQVRSYVANAAKMLAGNGSGGFAGDGSSLEEWRFQHPAGMIRDAAGNLLIADTANGRIRRIATDGSLSTLVAGLGYPGYFALDRSNLLYFSDSKTGTIHRIDRAGRLQVFSRGSGSKPFRAPTGLAFDARGDLYVADTGNNLIRKIAPDGFVSTVAGGGSSDKDGFGLSLELKGPVGIAVSPEGEIWFSESTRLRKLASDGRITTVPGVPLVEGKGIGFDSQSRLLVADAGGHRIIRVSRDGTWEPLAGSGDRGFSGETGIALQAMFDSPAYAWPEMDGSILIADTGNSRIRKTNPTTEVSSEVKLGSFRILHPGTLKTGAVAPGQLVYIQCDQEPLPGALEVRFGSEAAKVLSVDRSRIAAIVPAAATPGSIEVTLGDSKGKWAVAPVEIAAVAPAIVGGIQNENGSPNTLDAPAVRGTFVTAFVTGEGNWAEPEVSAEVSGITAGIVSVARPVDQPGLLKITLQVPSGYLPSGSQSLRIWVNGVRTLEDAILVCQ
jgi:uncharacterized protein (TIGR03437 family)